NGGGSACSAPALDRNCSPEFASGANAEMNAVAASGGSIRIRRAPAAMPLRAAVSSSSSFSTNRSSNGTVLSDVRAASVDVDIIIPSGVCRETMFMGFLQRVLVQLIVDGCGICEPGVEFPICGQLRRRRRIGMSDRFGQPPNAALQPCDGLVEGF